MKKLFVVGLLALLLGEEMQAQKYEVIDLGTLGGSSSEAQAVNNKGQVAGWSYVNSENVFQAFIYQNGSMQPLGTLGGSFSRAYGINNAGEVVGDAYTVGNSSIHAFLYRNGLMQDIEVLSGVQSRGSIAYGINLKGQVIGQWDDSRGSSFSHAFLYQNGYIQDLGTLGGSLSKAGGINSHGEIVGYSFVFGDTTTRAFLYSNESMQGIPTIGGSYSAANAINEVGQIVGAYVPIVGGGTKAFLYSDQSLKNLGTLGGNSSTAYSINSRGEIVGSSQVRGIVTHAFLYSDGSMKDLNDLIEPTSGWVLIRANAINDNGQIVGYGSNSLGQSHAFLLNPLLEGWTIVTNELILPTYPPAVVKGVGKENLIVVTHGRIPFGDSPEESTAWIYTMTNHIGQYLMSHNLTNWQVHAQDWSHKAQVIVASVLLNAEQEGITFGKQLAPQGWDHVHLIAHSSGADLIQATSEKIKSGSFDTTVHCTFLDPFVGTLNEKRTEYGQGADWADHYYSEGDLPFTEAFLPSAYNVDVTKLHKVDDYERFISSGPHVGEPCPQTISAHDSPILFYSKTITGEVSPEYEGFGFPLSKEGGEWDYATATYKVGNIIPHELGVPDSKCLTVVKAKNQPAMEIDFSTSHSKDSITGIIKKIGTSLHLIPQSPVWTSVFVTPTNVVSTISFEVEFLSTNGSRGLLSVYWDTNILGSIDERTVLPGLNQYTLSFPRAMVHTLHMLGFRLDSFSPVVAPVIVTNVILGHEGVKQPFRLLSINTTSVGLPVFELFGEPDFNYVVQASVDMINWKTIALLVNTNGSVQFVDHKSTNFSQRFYRVLAP